MNTHPTVLYQPVPPALEALQFDSLIEIYVDLGLNRAQAAAAAQADYLCTNLVAFRQRNSLHEAYFFFGDAA